MLEYTNVPQHHSPTLSLFHSWLHWGCLLHPCRTHSFHQLHNPLPSCPQINLEHLWHSLPFLDIFVSISVNRLYTDIYFKPTDFHNDFDCTSSYHVSCKDTIPSLQFLCLHRIVSQDVAFWSGTLWCPLSSANVVPTIIVNRTFICVSSVSCRSTIVHHFRQADQG